MAHLHEHLKMDALISTDLCKAYGDACDVLEIVERAGQHTYLKLVLLEGSEDAMERKNCELRQQRDRFRPVRETLGQRKHTLQAARLLPPQSQTLTKESQDLSVLSQTIARARSGLVQELVEFGDDLQWAGGQAQEENGLLADWFFQYREMLDFRGLAEGSASVCLESKQDEGLPSWGSSQRLLKQYKALAHLK
ncbi:uncharacterized protein HD556DRAFT_1536935 [Suillus plorans]|uniref:Uncharacterized protein n=1 Tax=Suillus plorans TaxID=116603 RepID=A0A9P7AM18_9AGAM|nr:uncharacterized protein HD556DRAFT_1536935 [Suillus plorans]KAG1792262.1 hypothetical protein HD556DRAFT_1536935 [Suillus plorans]